MDFWKIEMFKIAIFEISKNEKKNGKSKKHGKNNNKNGFFHFLFIFISQQIRLRKFIWLLDFFFEVIGCASCNLWPLAVHSIITMAEPLTFGGRNHNNMEDLPMGQTAVEDFPCRHGTGRWYWQAGERAGRQALCVSAFCALRRSGWLCIDCVLRLFAGSQAEINGWLFSCSAPSHVYFQDVHTSGRFANQWLRTAILVFQSRMPQERLQDVIIIFRSMYEKRFFGGLLIHFFFIFFSIFQRIRKAAV